MRFTLKEYQVEAVRASLSNLVDARDFVRRRARPCAFSLTATTGAGKTVMAAAVIEALFFGDESLEFSGDPGAVVIWFSDDPSLNEQTRFRLLEATDKLPHSRLTVVQNSFNSEKFEPGSVYFLNTSKLSKNALLVRGHVDERQEYLPGLDPAARPDLRAYTIWDTIRNTIEDENLTLYLILDEAHRGIRTATSASLEEKSTIVLRLINGHAGVPAMPVVWGISATVARFDAAMRGVEGRTILPAVVVDASQVQASGLLKDDIVLDIPGEAGTFDSVLLTRATRKLRESSAAWHEYCIVQGERQVIPLMVIQSPNTPESAMLARALDTVYSEWPDLPANAVAHVFGEHTTLTLGHYVVPYIRPEHVQEATHVRILIAKDAISTGWDCPRAEVLVSFRPAHDDTHITQLLGRMVRTPLARRVPGNDRLNSVDCILPFFDRKTATSVVKTLMGVGAADDIDGRGGSGGGNGRRVLIDPQEMLPNPAVPEDVWQKFDELPTQSLPRRNARPVKRLTALAHALVVDGLRAGAGKTAHAELHAVLDGLTVRYGGRLATMMTEVQTVEGESVRGVVGENQVQYSPFSELADEKVIHEAYRAAGRVFSPDLARTYVEHLAGAGDDDAEEGLRSAYLTIAGLAMVPEVKTELEREADRLAISWLAEHRVAIRGLGDERQAVYNELQAQAVDPQRVSLLRPKVRTEESRQPDGALLATRQLHLLCDWQGNFPIGGLGSSWERRVLDGEFGQSGLVAWYRNPGRSSADSLAVAYEGSNGEWQMMRPDFIFFTRSSAAGSIRASIVDPHGIYLADCLPKLRGLARFARQFAEEFHRVEAVAEVGGVLRVLDLTRESVRHAVEAAADAEQLYSSRHASNY